MFLALVRRGLWEQPDDLSGLRLSAEQWGEVYECAKSQTVRGLVMRGMELASAEGVEMNVPLTVKANLMAAGSRCGRRYAEMEAAGKKLFSLYEAKGVHPVMLKGISVAGLYEQPELRECGDIDVYFAPEEFGRVKVEGAERKADGSYAFKYEGETIEIHDHVIDVERPRAKKIAEKMVVERGFVCVGAGGVAAGGLRTVGPRTTLMLLNTHILKHAIGMGVGLRQMCDYARAHVAYADEVAGYMDDMEKLGLAKWTEVLDCFCSKYLAMPCEREFSERAVKVAEELLSVVMEGGNFGFESRRGEGVWNTARGFLTNMTFAFKLSVPETIWTFVSLVKGRLK